MSALESRSSTSACPRSTASATQGAGGPLRALLA